MGFPIVMVISRLHPGGAERQFCMLASGLARRGFDVSVLTYRTGSFYDYLLDKDVSLSIQRIRSRSRVGIVWGMRRAIRKRRPAAVIAFLPKPSILAEVAGMPRRNFAVIVSERSWNPYRRLESLRYFFHRFADVVVSNSYAQQCRLQCVAGHLAGRTRVIVNGVDLERFKPSDRVHRTATRRLRILVLARVVHEKNPLALLNAIAIISREHPYCDAVVDWFGAKPTKGKSAYSPDRMGYYRRVHQAIGDLQLRDRFRLHAEFKDVTRLYHSADVACLPSVAEGCSNFICEAMACGVPVLASRIGDNPRLVQEGRNGFLFDPSSPVAISRAIIRFSTLSASQRQEMGLEGRKMAEAMLSPKVCVDQYAELLDKVIQERGWIAQR